MYAAHIANEISFVRPPIDQIADWPQTNVIKIQLNKFGDFLVFIRKMSRCGNLIYSSE